MKPECIGRYRVKLICAGPEQRRWLMPTLEDAKIFALNMVLGTPIEASIVDILTRDETVVRDEGYTSRSMT